jgi:hypothetical protein
VRVSAFLYRLYTDEDVALLARVGRAHERLSGPAAQHILKREFEVYGKREFERLACISNGQLYNLRASPEYRNKTLHYEKTRPAKVSIGERRKPAPNGVPGYLRIDTVHQGGSPEGKGLYHLNAADEVTQWEIVRRNPFDQRGIPACRARSDAAPVPLRGQGIPLRQRLGVESTGSLPACSQSC